MKFILNSITLKSVSIVSSKYDLESKLLARVRSHSILVTLAIVCLSQVI